MRKLVIPSSPGKRRRFTPKQRLAIFQREAGRAQAEGRGDGGNPVCLHCGLPVLAGIDAFDIAHAPERPHCLGGETVGVAHRACNRRDGAQNVTPMFAKVTRVQQRHIGARGPGLGPRPMAGGRFDAISKTFRHGVVPRLSAAERHAIALNGRAARLPADIDWQDFPPIQEG